MPSPFPGMDPYLEEAELWPGFHTNLVVELQRRLNHQMSPKYYADIEVYSSADDTDIEISTRVRPDLSVTEPIGAVPEAEYATAGVAVLTAPLVRAVPLPTRLRSVRIYHTATRELVTAIEILSPTNKRPWGDGIRDYRRKRELILRSDVHLVELDLLRGGERPGVELVEDPLDTDYVLVVNRARAKRLSEIWPVALNVALPLIPVPLMAPDPDIVLDMNAIVHAIYDSASYERRIDYQSPVPPPAVRPALAEWVAGVLAARVRPA